MSKRQKLIKFRRRSSIIRWNRCKDELESIVIEAGELEFDPMIPMLEAMKKAVASHIAQEIIRVYLSDNNTSSLSE